MLMTIYGRAFKVLMKKPLKLWGLSLLAILLSFVLGALCGGAIPGLALCVGALIGTSMTIIFLRGYRGEEVKTVMLFECFKDWNTIKRVLLGIGWMWLWIFLWALIPVVGPILALIRIYEYRLTPYILVFEPEIPITETIKVSAQKTGGYKLQMWLADFVYSAIFCVIIFVLSLLSLIPYVGILFMLIMFLVYLVIFAFAPLFGGLIQAAFYEEITGDNNCFCPDCGAKLYKGVAFCSNCGKALEQ